MTLSILSNPRAVSAFALLLAACSSESGTLPIGETGGSASVSHGGTTSAPGQGGATATQLGGAPGSGGAQVGSGGAVGQGGSGSGGIVNSAGGASQGGANQGQGGATGFAGFSFGNGGASRGGSSNGGGNNAGGTSAGGNGAGGRASGGASAGGTANGGRAAGGAASGGAASGGRASGGAASGGAASGGAASGGTGGDPFGGPSVCTSNTRWTSGNGATMRPGEACVGCHSNFTIAGTVYPTGHEPNDCNGVGTSAGASVIITPASGSALTLAVNSVGNFYSTTRITTPYTAKVQTSKGTRAMAASQTNGNCNSCHTQNGASSAPGRIVVP